jgi:outer membrane protein OmpA-like peptidoglycan-associated protein
MRKSLFAASMLALTVAVAPACATKKFVRTEVGNVNGKVDTLAGTVEETQERTRKNEERIGAVDQKAEAAGRSATEARAAADQAATAAKDVDSRLGGRINTVEAASRKLVFEVTLSEDQGNFAFGKAELPDPAKARLDEVIRQVKADPKNIFFEVEGHTDNVGNPEYNRLLGLERAEAVKRYLYEQHQSPLHKINVPQRGAEIGGPQEAVGLGTRQRAGRVEVATAGANRVGVRERQAERVWAKLSGTAKKQAGSVRTLNGGLATGSRLGLVKSRFEL